MKAATREQQIVTFIEQCGDRPPTIREIGRSIGMKSSGDVHHYLSGLVERGVLVKRAGTRGYIRAQPEAQGRCCPTCGRPREEGEG